ncbi:MAG: Ubiquinol-cytochrome c reductase iron-sulfur subunit [Alphaproteobacteria bacterium MarineAlpha5_Bin11]|nr:MAG: Ubiquinol-cytochrome c reductase iron-sulfur subunit [Alphaproteobacteria bacterium MarineAlpha5_Bin11]PPR52192.1 MAG: Ubiquinol-cytochrome c reductase iron-sulfur subunit [Alphaproteobacteria bacterium MarineAlpha5_Bin10]|tara:strand:+ start:134 stop:796 length:663 start_codon:yes stop_codon:yes gene_type:complete
MNTAYLILLVLIVLIFLFIYYISTRVWFVVDKKNQELKSSSESPNNEKVADDTRRDFLSLSTITIGGIGTAAFIWPFLKSMNPAEDTLALGSTEVDISSIEEGQSITVKWRGKPVFIRRRTKKEIDEANKVNIQSLPDPAQDTDRVQKPEWLILVGVCTHLGCVPLGQKISDKKGEYNGWYCPCHGSHYDTSGRIRKGPAPDNLAVPPYKFLNDNIVKIG